LPLKWEEVNDSFCPHRLPEVDYMTTMELITRKEFLANLTCLEVTFLFVKDASV